MNRLRLLLLLLLPLPLIAQNATVTATLLSEFEVKNLVAIWAQPFEISYLVIGAIFISVVNFQNLRDLAIPAGHAFWFFVFRKNHSNSRSSWFQFPPATTGAYTLSVFLHERGFVRTVANLTCLCYAIPILSCPSAHAFRRTEIVLLYGRRPTFEIFSAFLANYINHDSLRGRKGMFSMPIYITSSAAKSSWLTLVPFSENLETLWAALLRSSAYLSRNLLVGFSKVSSSAIRGTKNLPLPVGFKRSVAQCA